MRDERECVRKKRTGKMNGDERLPFGSYERKKKKKKQSGATFNF
jgi:hypothetical protein